MKPLFCIGVLTLSFSLVGCGPAVRVVSDAIGNRSAAQSPVDTAGYVGALTAFPGGAGLVVFDPICNTASDNDFSTGLTRWLHLQSAGQPSLGQSALWGTFRNMEQPLGVSNARLSGPKAREAANYFAATHFVTSRYERLGNDKFRLELSVYATKNPAKVLRLIRAEGARDKIIAQLPSLATQIAQFVSGKGKNGKLVPITQTALSASEFALLGKYPHRLEYGESVLPSDAKQLRAMQTKDALAALVAGRLAFRDNQDSTAWFENARILTRLAPQNALAWSDVASQDAARLAPFATSLEGLATKFPHNALFAFAQTQWAGSQSNGAVEVQHAERTVRCAPGNPLLWQFLSDAHANQAGGIRRGRYARQVSRSEWKKLNAIYASGYASALHATKLAPTDAGAWAELASAATFVEVDEGVAALDKALQLDPDNAAALSWGMQLTQTKWTGDIERYLAFVRDAAKRADKFDFNAFHVINVLRQAKRTDDLVWILETAHKSAPKNASICAELGQWYHYNDRNYAKARPLYQAALKIDPRNASAINGLADLTYFLDGNNTEAERLYRLAYQLRADGYNAANLGRFLAWTGRKAEGVKLANDAKALGFSDRNHQVWSATGVSP
jgi:tetratricopeptide (TPR) repeat protein